MFIERSELLDYDIVTYSFGDQEAVYLRGQWTIHRNSIAVSTIWKGCPHLAVQLQKELLLKVCSDRSVSPGHLGWRCGLACMRVCSQHGEPIIWTTLGFGGSKLVDASSCVLLTASLCWLVRRLNCLRRSGNDESKGLISCLLDHLGSMGAPDGISGYSKLPQTVPICGRLLLTEGGGSEISQDQDKQQAGTAPALTFR